MATHNQKRVLRALKLFGCVSWYVKCFESLKALLAESSRHLPILLKSFKGVLKAEKQLCLSWYLELLDKSSTIHHSLFINPELQNTIYCNLQNTKNTKASTFDGNAK